MHYERILQNELWYEIKSQIELLQCECDTGLIEPTSSR